MQREERTCMAFHYHQSTSGNRIVGLETALSYTLELGKDVITQKVASPRGA